MKKAILIYASKHHGNTYKLAKAISEKEACDLAIFSRQVGKGTDVFTSTDLQELHNS